MSTVRAGRASRTVLAVFVGTQLGMILATLDGTIVATALPTISRDLGHSAQRSWVITGYMLGQVATMPLYGKLGDLYGRKRIYLFALGVFTLGSVLCGSAATLGQLVGFRLLQGIGAGGIGTLAMAIVADIVPARQLGRWLGYQGALFGVASLIGPLTGGFFVDQLSWRWAFYVNLPLAAVSIVLVVTKLHLPYRRVRHSLDVAGAALLTGALALVIVLAAIGGQQVAWLSPEVVTLGSGAVLLGVACWFRERRAREPVLPPRVLARRVVRVAGGLNLTSGALFAAGVFFLPVFFQQVAGASPTESGLFLVPFMFTIALTTLIAGRRVEHTGRYRVWPIVGSAVALVGVGLLASLTVGTPVVVAAGFGAVLGVGIGFIMQTSLLALQNGVEQRDLGVATSTALLGRILGVTLGAALASAVLESGIGGAGLGDVSAYAGAIHSVFLAAVPVAIVTVVLAWRLPEHELRTQSGYDADEALVALQLSADTGLG